MTEITIRVLGEPDWQLYRQVRLNALEESPQSFTATLDDESARDEQFWRDRMTRSHRLLAERDQQPQGIISLGPDPDKPLTGEIFGLYVFPEVRGTGVSWKLVEAAADLAVQDGYRQIFYWVGTDNPRAIGFAKNFGFRLTGHRRASQVTQRDLGEEEIALVMSLIDDDSSVPNPNSGHVAPLEGPLR
jgi:RimJ/RimL family protein N-acetyltransferase